MTDKNEAHRTLMDMGKTIPVDIDWDWYIKDAEKILVNIGWN